MKNRLLLSVFTIMACTSAAMAEEETTTYPLVLTGLKVDNTTMTTTVVRDGTTVTLGSGSAVSVGNTLTFTYTPNNGYYFSDGTNSAKTESLELTADMVNSVSTESIDITGATFTTDGTWTEVIGDGTDVAPSNSNTNYYTRTEGWKVNIPRTDQDSKTISATINEFGTLSFDYGVNNGYTAYGTFYVYLYINNKDTAEYNDFMSEDASLSESEKYRKNTHIYLCGLHCG